MAYIRLPGTARRSVKQEQERITARRSVKQEQERITARHDRKESVPHGKS